MFRSTAQTKTNTTPATRDASGATSGYRHGRYTSPGSVIGVMAAFATSLACALALSTGAGAVTTTTTSPTTTTAPVATTTSTTSGIWSATPSGTDASSYSSLASAMVTYWAGQSNSDLSNFVANNSSQLGTTLAPKTAAPLLTAAQNGTLTPSSLNSALAQSGATLDITGMGSMDGLLTQLQSKSQTLDGQAVINGATWATQLGGLYSPSLNTSMATPDALSAGLLYDAGLSNLVSKNPNLFATVNGSGLGTAAGQQAWANSLASAGAGLNPTMSSLPNPCMAGMMQSMASGQVTANAGLGGLSCGPCQVAGTYLHSNFMNIFNPAANSVIPTSGTGNTNANGLSGTQNWLQQAETSQNPGLASQLNTSFGGAGMAGSCSGSSAATSGALGISLPGVFSALGK